MKSSGNYALRNYKYKENFWTGLQLAAALFALTAIALYRLPAGLWLDETLTAWVIREDIFTTFSRALHFQGQSPFYYLLIHGWTLIFGTSELAFRTFSLGAFISGCVFLYLIHRQSFSPELAICGTILSGTLLIMYVHALDARPYGLVIALSMGSHYFFLDWLDTTSRQSRLFHVLCSVAAIYTHWLYGTILIVQTFLILCAGGLDKKPYIRQWIINLLAIGILCSPNAYQLGLIFQKRFTYNYLLSPNLSILAKTIFPIQTVSLCAMPILLFIYRYKNISFKGLLKPISIGASWILIPPLVLFFISLLFNASVLSPRYAGASYAGFGLITASLFSCLPVSTFRRFAMLIISVSGIILTFTAPHSASWREPAAFLGGLKQNNDKPVLLSSGLVESISKEWIQDSSKLGYFSAPIQYYLPDENPSPLPSPVDLTLLDDVLAESCNMNTLHKNGFFLIVREKKILNSGNVKLASEIFKRYFSDIGFSVRIAKAFPGIHVFEFETDTLASEGQVVFRQHDPHS